MAIHRPDWGASSDGGALVVSEERAPVFTFTQDDLAQISFDADAGNPAPLDDEQRAEYRRLLLGGVRTADDMKRHYGLSSQEIAELSRPAPSARSVAKSLDAQIIALQELRRTEPKRYWSAEVQERLFALHREREAAGALGVPSELVEEWRVSPMGLEWNLKAARERVQVAFRTSDLEPEEAQDLLDTYQDELSPRVQAQVGRFFVVDGGAWPDAKPAEIEEFNTTEIGPVLLAAWGRNAPRRLACAKRNGDQMMRGMTPTERGAVEAWVNRRTAPQRRAIIEALAGR